MKTVTAIDISGINATLFGTTIFKVNIKCGACESWFKSRLKFVSNPSVYCTNCKALNIVPVSP